LSNLLITGFSGRLQTSQVPVPALKSRPYQQDTARAMFIKSGARAFRVYPVPPRRTPILCLTSRTLQLLLQLQPCKFCILKFMNALLRRSLHAVSFLESSKESASSMLTMPFSIVTVAPAVPITDMTLDAGTSTQTVTISNTLDYRTLKIISGCSPTSSA